MQECEVCGRKGVLTRTLVEGTVLSVCSKCSGFGSRVPEVRPMTRKEEMPIEEVSIDPSFATIIRLRREALGLKIGELAKKINEKESTIARIEQGKMNPDVKTAKKLEKALEVRLFINEEESNT